ncbi:eIF2A-domain-containing protein [Gonapodya prolifera JEL478]|uniref:Eukaryotic translation initiation factor 2A n=1 Tax=Gonapodya prolifera (strain JEL478) TaxID=1344416 RepID=A0A139ATR2_GONPJ|nr:eIF2A-domain-containing protein [Gonapodya prolifera JEL478]|eukprot:KXS20117.1 eIF2A-domain-containing protein [Gonapodya prolifera JEL478]
MAVQLSYRSVAGLTVANGPPQAGAANGFESPQGNIRTFQYSSDGSRLAWIGPEGVRIVNAASGEVVRDITNKTIMEIGFSPKGTFISTWERYQKPATDDGPPHRNLIVWEVATGRQCSSFTSKVLQSNWDVKWTEDERYFARLVTGEIQFYDTRVPVGAAEEAPGTNGATANPVAFRLKLDNASDFAIAPVAYNPAVAVFVPEKKGQPGSVKIFSLTAAVSNPNPAPLASKTFFKAEKAQFIWNGVGTAVLVLTQTEVASGNVNYYGDSALYYLSTNGKYDARVTLGDDGPIHDVHWHPNSGEFAVTSGRMPSQTTLFNPSCEPVFSFPRSHRNYLRYSPTGRLICIAGFGNLAGDMDFWDRRTLRKVATVHAPNSTFAAWSPDGRYLLTATLTPRLRVDNGYRVWHYTGVVVDKRDVNEMYQIGWRPDPTLGRWQDANNRELSPAPKGVEEANGESGAQTNGNGTAAASPAKPVRPAGKYIPPGARDRDASSAGVLYGRREEGGLPGLAGLEQHLERNAGGGSKEVPGYSRDGRDNRDNRDNRQGQGQGRRGGYQAQGGQSRDGRGGSTQGGRQGNRNNQPPPPSAPAPVNGSGSDASVVPPMPAPQHEVKDPAVAEAEKKIRTVQKKLKEISDLKAKMAAGQKLELTQISKMEKEADFLLEVESLTAGMKKLASSFN